MLIEAKYSSRVDADAVRQYLLELATELNLRTYGEPTIHSPGAQGKDINQGYDAFVPLIDSGISLYIWINERFISCVVYTCRDFPTDAAIRFTQDFFQTTEIEWQEF